MISCSTKRTNEDDGKSQIKLDVLEIQIEIGNQFTVPIKFKLEILIMNSNFKYKIIKIQFVPVGVMTICLGQQHLSTLVTSKRNNIIIHSLLKYA